MYSQRLLDHFQNPRNVGELPAPAITVEATNPACGDLLRLSVLFQNDVAGQVRFQAKGCTAAVAAGSALTELIQGKHRSEIGKLRARSVENALGGLPPESKHAAVLSIDAVHALLCKPA